MAKQSIIEIKNCNQSVKKLETKENTKEKKVKYNKDKTQGNNDSITDIIESTTVKKESLHVCVMSE